MLVVTCVTVAEHDSAAATENCQPKEHEDDRRDDDRDQQGGDNEYLILAPNRRDVARWLSRWCRAGLLG